MKITVNGREHEIEADPKRGKTVVMKQLRYESICELAGVPEASRPSITFQNRQSSGEVCPGGSVAIFDGTVINCTVTNRA